MLVYDITNRWSFDGIRRWLKEIDEASETRECCVKEFHRKPLLILQHAPGVPRILIGNRLHLEFNRAVSREEAEAFAAKRHMEYFEVSTLASFNIHESLTELSRLVLTRNGMERLYRSNRGRFICAQLILSRFEAYFATFNYLIIKTANLSAFNLVCYSRIFTATFAIDFGYTTYVGIFNIFR